MNEKAQEKSGFQITEEQKKQQKIIVALAQEMKLRQWCVESALRCPEVVVENLRQLAQDLYEFVTDLSDESK